MSIEQIAEHLDAEAPAPFEDDSSEQDIAEAKSMGWKDPKEWKGDPPKNGFVKAKEFVERGKDILPIVNSQLKKKDAELARLRDELDRTKRESDDKLARLEKMSERALKSQRKQLEEKYEALKENVIETGDKAEYKRIAKEEREALKEFDEAIADKADDKPKKAKDEIPVSMKEAIDEWLADNGTWFNSEPEMQAVANAYHEKLLKTQPGLSIKDNLAKVRERVEKLFPDEFGKKAKDDEDDDEPRRSRVEGGSRSAGGGPKSAWSRLPSDAQKQADKFIKDDGLFLEKGETVEKDIGKARERYAKQYFGE
jgi:hypothetical protein